MYVCVCVIVWKQENCRYKSWKDFGRVRAWLMTQLRWNEKREGRGKAQDNCAMSDRRSLSLFLHSNCIRYFGSIINCNLLFVFISYIVNQFHLFRFGSCPSLACFSFCNNHACVFMSVCVLFLLSAFCAAYSLHIAKFAFDWQFWFVCVPLCKARGNREQQQKLTVKGKETSNNTCWRPLSYSLSTVVVVAKHHRGR